MTVWTIYDRFPDPYIARRSDGAHRMLSEDLIELRVRMARLGLRCLGRNFFDADDIVEVWLTEEDADAYQGYAGRSVAGHWPRRHGRARCDGLLLPAERAPLRNG